MRCPTCGGAMLTERPHLHVATGGNSTAPTPRDVLADCHCQHPSGGMCMYALTRREPLDVERLAFAYIRVRGAHNPTGDELVMDEEVRPCAWCRLAAEQAIEAIARLEDADKP